MDITQKHLEGLLESVSEDDHMFNIKYDSKKVKAWNEMFKFYNDNSGFHLGMGCRPCYGKVYTFISGYVQAEDTEYYVRMYRENKKLEQLRRWK